MTINATQGSQPWARQPDLQQGPSYGPQGPPYGPHGHNQLQFDPRDIEDNRAIAALAYLWILFLIPMLARPQSRFARAHTNQGIILFIISIIFWVGSMILSWVPLVNIIWWLASGVFTLIYVIFAIVQIVHCLQGRFRELPLVGGFSVFK
jgi:uncharacterized membrane protein